MQPPEKDIIDLTEFNLRLSNYQIYKQIIANILDKYDDPHMMPPVLTDIFISKIELRKAVAYIGCIIDILEPGTCRKDILDVVVKYSDNRNHEKKVRESILANKLSKLVLDKKTPHFPLSYFEFKVKNTNDQYFKEIYIMEKLDTTLLAYLLSLKGISEILVKKYVESAVVQIMQALLIALKEYRFMHFDLSLDNIMATNINIDTSYCYIINKKKYLIPTYGKCWKIIDYGWAVSIDIFKDTPQYYDYDDMCLNDYQCFDMYFFIHRLQIKLKENFTLDNIFVDKLLSELDINHKNYRNPASPKLKLQELFEQYAEPFFVANIEDLDDISLNQCFTDMSDKKLVPMGCAGEATAITSSTLCTTIFSEQLASKLYDIIKQLFSVVMVALPSHRIVKYIPLYTVISVYDSINAYLQLYSDYGGTPLDDLAHWRKKARPVPQHKTENIIIPEIAEKITDLLPYFSALNNLNQLPLELGMNIYDIIVSIIKINSTFTETNDYFYKHRITAQITVDDVIIGKSLTKPTAVKLFIAFNKLPDKAVNRVLSRAFCNELFDTLHQLINDDISLSTIDKAILMSYICTINVTDKSGMKMFDITKIYDSIFNFTKIAINYEPFEDVLRQFRAQCGGKSPTKKKSPTKMQALIKKQSPTKMQALLKKQSLTKKKSPIKKKLSGKK